MNTNRNSIQALTCLAVVAVIVAAFGHFAPRGEGQVVSVRPRDWPPHPRDIVGLVIPIMSNIPPGGTVTLLDVPTDKWFVMTGLDKARTQHSSNDWWRVVEVTGAITPKTPTFMTTNEEIDVTSQDGLGLVFAPGSSVAIEAVNATIPWFKAERLSGYYVGN